jgi:hypothetical protein
LAVNSPSGFLILNSPCGTWQTMSLGIDGLSVFAPG